MEKQCDDLYQKLVTDRNEVEKHYHNLKEYQWTYIRELNHLLNRPPPTYVVENLYNHVHTVRQANSLLYKQSRYRLCNESHEGYVVVFEPSECQSTV